jgi:glycosyltransferase involved in cell wall biosynthesis
MGDALAGELSIADVRARMSASAVFVLPSHSEGQPISVLEAMACALPVIATRVGGIPETVRDGVDGIIVDPGNVGALSDAIERLVTRPQLRREMGAAARRRVQERYDMPRFREHLGVLYRAVAQDGG